MKSSSMPMRPAVAVPSPRRQKMAFATTAIDAARIAVTLRSVVDTGIDRAKVAKLRQTIGRGLYLADCRLVAEGLLASVRFGWSH